MEEKHDPKLKITRNLIKTLNLADRRQEKSLDQNLCETKRDNENFNKDNNIGFETFIIILSKIVGRYFYTFDLLFVLKKIFGILLEFIRLI